ncbi:hypothetical protein [Fimbriiglobus ruber]|uniref:Uncharacterized protein n=1 Tax=Fimbriiglobus ruber TaxID=1908690 RepID=A0A225DKA6_9BACT|nr:hypothetical protein [Fimbriiglobus ruber]OWK37876.1 hypothetical protein FRUB_06996 [Fimbriiglobus ruber]
MTPFTSWPEPSVSEFAPHDHARSSQEVVEVQLLLPMWQASALEAEARARGKTTGQLLRKMINDMFAEPLSVGT